MSVEVLRESACDCIHEIIMKGMELGKERTGGISSERSEEKQHP